MNTLFNTKSIAAAIAMTMTSFGAFAGDMATDAPQQAPQQEVQKEVEKLGGGFIVGMSQLQTCLYFKENYRSRNENNYLCRMIDRKDFSNLTVVNTKITNGMKRIQQIENIAFFFNENEELRLVMSVEDMSHDAGGKREFIHMNQVAMRGHYY